MSNERKMTMETKHGTIIPIDAFTTEYRGLKVHKKPSILADGYRDVYDFDIYWSPGVKLSLHGEESLTQCIKIIDEWIHLQMNHDMYREES